MSLAPEQIDAALDGLGDGSSELVGVGSLVGPVEPDGPGPSDSVGDGPLELEASGPPLGLELGAPLAGPLPGTLLPGPVVGVPSPQAESASNPAESNRESRTVPAVRGRMGVTHQA